MAIDAMIIIVFVVFAYQIMIVRRARVELQLETDNRTIFRIYYKYKGEQWNQKYTASQLIQPGIKNYSFRLADIADIDEIRIDTSERQAVVKLKSLVISQIGYVPLRFNSDEDFTKLQPIAGIASVKIDQGLTVTPSSNDPQLLFVLPENLRKNLSIHDVATPITLCIISLMFFFLMHPLFTDYRFSTVFCCGVLSFIVAMAVVSGTNQHPDERVHIQAANYYINHWSPPKIGDPEILSSYSTYGVSRLHSGEIAYFVAGKFARLLAPFQFPTYLIFRFFNIILFAALVILSVRSIHIRILLVPLLLSPQIWYVFSYFNSEAFAAFLMMTASYQLVAPNSSWNAFLDTDKERFPLYKVCGLVILCSLLLLLKVNFYFFILFIGCYMVWRFVFGKTRLNRALIVRVIALLLASMCLFAAIRGIDNYVNGFNKKERLVEARELYADKMFKPSTPLDKRSITLQMRDRGVGLREFIDRFRWGEKMFRSAVGEYGYMNVAASFDHYDAVRYSSLLLAAFVILSILVKGGLSEIALTAIVLACSFLLMGASLYHAWTVDFQAQGRYLLPIVGMLSVCFYHLRNHLRNLPCQMVYLFVFGLSVYSFVFIGLAGIGKVIEVLG